MEEANNIFVYGSMLSPDVVKAVTGHDILSVSAHLKDYSRRKLKNRDYPGIIHSQGSMVIGKVLRDVRHELLQLINIFEGDEYLEQKTKAILEDGNGIDVLTYVWNGSIEDVQDDDWDFAYFESHKLRTFLSQTFDIMSGNPLKENYND